MALLSQIIKAYIKTALPVGSKFLVNNGNFNVSAATIRNEMGELEKEGYIMQPHTSAGRVPTAKGYEYFLSTVKEGRLAAGDAAILKKVIKQRQSETLDVLIKELAKKIADLSNNTVVIGFSSNDVYYTGLANLFSQPEFRDPGTVYQMSLIIDHLDRVMAEIFDQINRDRVVISIGQNNPFGRQCSSLISVWGQKKKGIFGIIGPMRMDYEKNLGLLNFIKQHI